MTVRRTFSVVAALLAVLAGASCSDRDGAPLPAETDEPFYVQGKQLIKQGRNPEALTSFLKVIDRRGERGAAESHLEAGYIYLVHTKDPVEAYHHFRRYLALQPNSKEAAGVRGKVEEAKREFARTLPARPMEDQSARMQSDESFERLRREIEELRAQNATLRGAGAAPMTRSTPTLSLPDDLTPRATPPPVTSVADSSTSGTPSSKTAPALQTPTIQPPLRNSPGTQSRTTTPTRPTTTGVRTHTVAQKDTLFGISMKFYGNSQQVEAIYQANRDVMKNRTDLKPGMTLKIPAVDVAPAPRR